MTNLHDVARHCSVLLVQAGSQLTLVQEGAHVQEGHQAQARGQSQVQPVPVLHAQAGAQAGRQRWALALPTRGRAVYAVSELLQRDQVLAERFSLLTRAEGRLAWLSGYVYGYGRRRQPGGRRSM